MLGRVLEQRMTSTIFLHLCARKPLFLGAASGAQEPSGGAEGSRGLEPAQQLSRSPWLTAVGGIQSDFRMNSQLLVT